MVIKHRGVKVFYSRRLKEKCRQLIIFYVLRAAPNMRDAKRRSCEGGFGGPPPGNFLKVDTIWWHLVCFIAK